MKNRYQLIEELSDNAAEGDEVLGWLQEVRDKSHLDLAMASIRCAWMLADTIDKDGHRKLGQMKLCSELEYQLHGADAILITNREAWREMEDNQRKAYVDHELCHLRQKLGKDGQQEEDESGRKLWRLAKHDLEEFRDVVARHGCYMSDIQEFVEAALRDKALDKSAPLFAKPLTDRESLGTN